MYTGDNEKCITPDNEILQYRGRIDFSALQAPVFIFPGSSVYLSFTGSKLKVLIKNNHRYFDNFIGYIIDGVQKKVLLSNSCHIQKISLAEDLKENINHEVVLFKRQDTCHEFTFYGFILPEDSNVSAPHKKYRKCMEFYGEAAAAGELSEAADYTGKKDPNHNGEYSNAWYSYAMMTGRNLKAQVNIIAQSSITLLDKDMENIYDKPLQNPGFRQYTPHVVVIDLGQNDASGEDYMKNDPKRADIWKEHYRKFVLNMRRIYPNAFILLTTNIMNHHPSWDRAIGNICVEINDEKIKHFIYSCNGRGTPGCIRIPEAEQMAYELSIFLKKLGNEIWKDI